MTNQIAISSVNSDWNSRMGADAESVDVFNRGRGDYSRLSDGEKVRFGFLMRSYLERLTIGDFVARTGLGFTGSEFGARQIDILFDQQGFRQWWSEVDPRTLPLPTRELLQQAEQSVR